MRSATLATADSRSELDGIDSRTCPENRDGLDRDLGLFFAGFDPDLYQPGLTRRSCPRLRSATPGRLAGSVSISGRASVVRSQLYVSGIISKIARRSLALMARPPARPADRGGV